MRDYDPMILRKTDPKLYFQKWMEYNFRNNDAMERDLCKQYVDEIDIEDDLRDYLHRMLAHHDQSPHHTHHTAKSIPQRIKKR